MKISHPRYLLFGGVAVTSGSALAGLLPPVEAAVSGFDLGVIAFVLSCIPLWRNGKAGHLRMQAQRDDVGQGALLTITGLISAVMLGVVATLVMERGNLGIVHVAILVATLVASWTFTNLVLTFHYARLYYSPAHGGDHQGLDFPGVDEPDFSDFVNFAFVIGMTCQTADIAITKTAMRRIVTGHGLFAFFFNLGVLALTVNVLAGGAG